MPPRSGGHLAGRSARQSGRRRPAASYAAALWTHLAVGYVDFIHLLPVYVGMGVLYLALGLSRSYLWSTA
ncbi:MAG: hypothetical protein ACOY93_03505 [Bacillota bacterium]